MKTNHKGPINVVAHFTAKKGKASELRDWLRSLVNPTNAEPGCVMYKLNESLENVGSFVFIERFRDAKAFQAHMDAPYIKEFFALGGPADALTETRYIETYSSLRGLVE